MRKAIFSLYDCVAECYDHPMDFENFELGFAMTRRQVRQSYREGLVSAEFLMEHELHEIAEFDTVEGIFYNFDDLENKKTCLYDFVFDLVKVGDEIEVSD